MPLIDKFSIFCVIGALTLTACESPVAAVKNEVATPVKSILASGVIGEDGAISIVAKQQGEEGDSAIEFLTRTMAEFPNVFTPGAEVEVVDEAKATNAHRSGTQETHTVHSWGPLTTSGYSHTHFVNLFTWKSCRVTKYSATCRIGGESRTTEVHRY